MTPTAWMVAQATAGQPVPAPRRGVTPAQAQLIADIARRMGRVTYGGLVMETGLSRSTMERYTRAALAMEIVKITQRGRRKTRWIEAT